MRDRRRNLLEQFQPFRRNAEFDIGKAGDIAARPGKAFNDTETDRIDRLRKYDRHAAACLLQRQYRDTRTRQDHFGSERDQFRRMCLKAIGIAAAPAIVDLQIASDAPAQCPQSLYKNRVARLPSGTPAARFESAPIRRICSVCSAWTTKGHNAATPPSAPINSRRFSNWLQGTGRKYCIGCDRDNDQGRISLRYMKHGDAGGCRVDQNRPETRLTEFAVVSTPAAIDDILQRAAGLKTLDLLRDIFRDLVGVGVGGVVRGQHHLRMGPERAVRWQRLGGEDVERGARRACRRRGRPGYRPRSAGRRGRH